MSGSRISVVLPVYNEVGHIAFEVDRIRKNLEAGDRPFEVIVVDDGSTDGSSELLQEMEGIHLLRLPVNQGVGVARKWGTMQAQGDVVVWTDADMTYPNEDIAALVDQLEGFDQVVGARQTTGGSRNVFRHFAKWTIRRLAGYLTGKDIPDLNSGYRAFRRDAAAQYLHMFPRGFSCVTTLTMAFMTNGYSVKYVPIDYQPRAGESKFHWWWDTRRYLMQVVRMTLMWEPLRVFGPAAGVVALTGLGAFIYDLARGLGGVSANTLVLFALTLCLSVLGMTADVLVQLNRRASAVMPSTLEDHRSHEPDGDDDRALTPGHLPS
ncbi:N/A [soil metagenome]